MGELFERQWFHAEGQAGKKTFSVMSYNILNDHFTTNGYTYVKPELMLTSRRYPLVAEEVIHYDPDIVCMQEIGTEAFDIVNNKLSPHEYDGKQAKKPYGDGLAIFFKSRRFDLVDSSSVPLTFAEMEKQKLLEDSLTGHLAKKISDRTGERQKALFVKLKDKYTDRIVNIGTIHTIWNNFKFFDVQCLQITVALDAFWKFSNNGTEAFIMCGDFNTSPVMPTYRWMMEGKLTTKLIKDIQDSCKGGEEVVDIAALLKNSLKHKCKLESCYMKIMNKEPIITNCDDGFGDHYCEECLDYIFINPDFFDVIDVLETPDSCTIKKDFGLPNDIFPSDHISIMAKVAMKAENV